MVAWRGVDDALGLHAELHPTDRAYLERFKVRARRRQSEAARMLLRHCLGELGVEAGPILAEQGSRPRFEEPGLEFSLSHAQEQVGVVLAPVPVGIDIECLHREVDADAIAARFFSADEWALVRNREPSDAFWRLWTAKEAAFKWKGVTPTLGRAELSTFPSAPAGDEPGAWMHLGSLGQISWWRPAEGYLGGLSLPVGSALPPLRVL